MLNLSPNTLNQAFHPETQPKYVGDYSMMENYHQPWYQPHFNQLPSTETIDTEWGFDIDLNSESAGKTSWMFSTKLHKVFVKINTPLNVYHKYNIIDPNQSLFVRAMVVYQQTNDFADPVRKCPNHRDQSTRENLQFPEHVLRCMTQDTEYLGIEMGKLFKDRLALRIPLATVATGEPLKLQFTCQNSCSGGMNRRHTTVIFTLENEVGTIYGRKVMNFKVCSCPKRDKEKDEEVVGKSLPKKRKLDAPTAPSTSKKVAIQMPIVKQETDTTMSAINEIPMLPSDLQSVNSAELLELKREPQICDVQVTMPSPELKKQLLIHAYNLVAGAMSRTGDVGGLQRYLIDIQKQIGK